MIGGNVIAEIQMLSGDFKNAIGEVTQEFSTVHKLRGFLDYTSGEAGRANYNAKLQESSHVFICDYTRLHDDINAENSRVIIGSQTFDIVLIDDPMELHRHLEIYLKYTGR